jgi:two-component system nitrogen regulation sensor histidine kinase GlnL
MDQAIVTGDRTGTITSFNSQTTKLLGLAHDPFGQPLSELTDQIDLEAFRDTYNRSPARHASHDFLVQTHGRPIWLRTFCHPLRDAEGNVTGNVIQLRDVTSERHVEDQVRRMERFMGLGSLAVGLHHEIKKPLAAISLHAQLLEEQLASDPGADDVPGLLSVIRNEIQRVGAVLEGFRDFASTVKLERQEVNVRKMIEQQVELLRPQAERQQVEITRDYGEATPSMVYIDQTRIEQVLLNLLLNGIDAMQDGGQLRIETNRIDWESEPSLAIVVEDSGTGIPENIQDHIFDAYFTTKNSGTGMGLALSDKIVRQHGGRLEYTTGQTGTRFTMILPLSTDDAFTLSDN